MRFLWIRSLLFALVQYYQMLLGSTLPRSLTAIHIANCLQQHTCALSLLQTLAEIALPVLFMALLVWIKSITTAFDSPNVAYVCGQAKPFQYTEHLTPSASLVSCLTKPDVCTTPDYYR
jgi:hypothetical protein